VKVAFIDFEHRAQKRTTAPIVSINAKYGRLAFNAAGTELLREKKIKAVILRWDPDQRLIALKSADESDARSFPIIYGTRKKDLNTATINARSFLQWIEYSTDEATRPFNLTWKQGQFEIHLDSERSRK